MSTNGINIPVDEMRAIMGKAIIDSLSPTSKEQVIAGALEYLLAKPVTSPDYASKKTFGDSPIEVAMKDAVRQLCFEVAKEVAQTEARPRIVELAQEMLGKITALDADGDLKWKLMDALLSAADERIKEKRGY